MEKLLLYKLFLGGTFQLRHSRHENIPTNLSPVFVYLQPRKLNDSLKHLSYLFYLLLFKHDNTIFYVHITVLIQCINM